VKVIITQEPVGYKRIDRFVEETQTSFILVGILKAIMFIAGGAVITN